MMLDYTNIAIGGSAETLVGRPVRSFNRVVIAGIVRLCENRGNMRKAAME